MILGTVPVYKWRRRHHTSVEERPDQGRRTTMIRIKKNKPQISPEIKTFREVRRSNLNRTYIPLKIGLIAGYIVLGMLSASTSMFGILLGAMLRIAGL
jgi:hypothetical protein